ncbi:MAG TPA: ABC transporter permease subunit [Angustibacter sp.]|nr:ABC transporter permease subunit [Angustibacter sp.]
MSAAGSATRRARAHRRLRWVVMTLAGVFFLLPLWAMVVFSTSSPNGVTGETWRRLVDVGQLSRDYPSFVEGVKLSAYLVVLTVALMLVLLVPTMTWVRLRVPWLRRPMEFLCLLPLTIPAIVLVVGLAPVYAWVTYFFGGSSVWLFFAYTVLVLPYAYRAIDAGLSAIDVRTLSEAARGLGASWPRVFWSIITPNIRTALMSASFLSVALVLGEYTIASLMSRNNLQVSIFQLSQRTPSMSVAVSLAALLLAFVLLVGLSLLAGRRRRATVAATTAQAPSPVPAEEPS